MSLNDVVSAERLHIGFFGLRNAGKSSVVNSGVRKLMDADVAVSVTGLAGPGGDDYGNPVGTVFIGYSDESRTVVKPCLFSGDRESIRSQTIGAALQLILDMQK